MICKKCNNQINDNDNFCPHCGNELTNDNNKKSKEIAGLGSDLEYGKCLTS